MKKRDKDKKSESSSVILIVCIVIFIGVLILAFIPDSWFEKKTKHQEQVEQQMSNFADESEDESIRVVAEDSEGNIKYNTIYGGSDYSNAVQGYWDEHPLEKHNKIYEYTSQQNMYEEFDSLAHGVYKSSEMLNVHKAEDFTNVKWSAFQKVYFDKVLDLIGVQDRYFAICKMQGDDKDIFILDCREMYFNPKGSLLQIGVSLSATMDTKYTKQESDDNFNYIYIGAYDKSMPDEISSEIKASDLEEYLSSDMFEAEGKCRPIGSCNMDKLDYYGRYSNYKNISELLEKYKDSTDIVPCSFTELVYLGRVEDMECFDINGKEILVIPVLDGIDYEVGSQQAVTVPVMNIDTVGNVTDKNLTIVYARVVGVVGGR